MSTRALPEYARIAADVLIDLSSELERLGAGLCGDPHLLRLRIHEATFNR